MCSNPIVLQLKSTPDCLTTRARMRMDGALASRWNAAISAGLRRRSSTPPPRAQPLKKGQSTARWQRWSQQLHGSPSPVQSRAVAHPQGARGGAREAAPLCDCKREQAAIRFQRTPQVHGTSIRAPAASGHACVRNGHSAWVGLA